MDEIALVTAIAPPAPGLPAAVRDAARATLLAEIATEREAGTITGRATAPGSRPSITPKAAVAPGTSPFASNSSSARVACTLASSGLPLIESTRASSRNASA